MTRSRTSSYIRLAFLMGLTWLLLLVCLLVKQSWLWMMFDVVNTLPGLYICIAFLHNQRILSSIKQKLFGSLSTTLSTKNSTNVETLLKSPTSMSTSSKSAEHDVTATQSLITSATKVEKKSDTRAQ
ncbi:unnamed protein product [Didymodactylos carnosus]|uniref:Uncharacterized protein n=1 Tax=Didymodactylos carnosus TaxID=1234261 RepID=A0A814Y888_9BILA|nr:unnamed protein product [Didymodactylos carnosus]CAF3988508.1 unnamed protein product [Didymodactylos carnosus]